MANNGYSHFRYDPEAAMASKPSFGDYSLDFAEKQLRMGFIRKVFGILSVQLALTAIITAAFITSKPAKDYVFQNPWTFWTTFALSIVLLLVLVCSESARRSHPTNLILLMIFTILESFLVAFASAAIDTQLVLIAAGITAGITVCLTLYALQSKHDFTAMGGMLFAALFALIAGGIIGIFVKVQWFQIMISAAGALIFAMYIIYDVQLMMGGAKKYSISPDEYVLAALNIYLDIINLFLYILHLLNAVKE